MDKKILFLILVLLFAGLNTASIRRAEDPIRDTQSDAVSYKQKMEETKNGVKGPPSYSMKFNPKDTFFIDPPFEKSKKEEPQKEKATEAPAVTDWWEEEAPVAAQPSSGPEAVEPLPSQEETSGEARSQDEKAVAVPDQGKQTAPDEGADDYWW